MIMFENAPGRDLEMMAGIRKDDTSHSTVSDDENDDDDE